MTSFCNKASFFLALLLTPFIAAPAFTAPPRFAGLAWPTTHIPNTGVEAQLADRCGAPSAALLEVLEAFALKHDGSWDSILQVTQDKWIKQGERWKFPAHEDRQPEHSYALFTALGMTQAVCPTQSFYDYAVIFGATKPAVEQRFSFLKKQWERGLRFGALVLLTGDRPLDPAFEGNSQKNETQMMVALLESLELPQAWKCLPLIVIDTPAPTGKSRPNTADTFAHWLKMDLAPGSCLFISSQPFNARQGLLASQLLPKTFTTEVVGEGFTLEDYKKEPRGPTILLDELARWIYTMRRK